jgi:hypothetical protein
MPRECDGRELLSIARRSNGRQFGPSLPFGNNVRQFIGTAHGWRDAAHHHPATLPGSDPRSAVDVSRVVRTHHEKLVFNRLSYDHQLEIAQLLLDQELAFLKAKGREVTPDAMVLQFLVRRGFHPKLGTRPMRDAVEKLVGDAAAECLLGRRAACGVLGVDEVRDCLVIR